jgi:hypothetical protein
MAEQVSASLRVWDAAVLPAVVRDEYSVDFLRQVVWYLSQAEPAWCLVGFRLQEDDCLHWEAWCLRVGDTPEFRSEADDNLADDNLDDGSGRVACNAGDDIPSSRHTPDSPDNRAAADGTSRPAGDTHLPRSHPTVRGCSR